MTLCNANHPLFISPLLWRLYNVIEDAIVIPDTFIVRDGKSASRGCSDILIWTARGAAGKQNLFPVHFGEHAKSR